ncbi:PREDICTED: probable LRR receptor-like serine/threonine-protein kinase At1g74360 [Camelina sativa]|uniref:Probable LRR receptor-like serine/threonine-protein kinase At1g74360 n=1 Tax=Camelina sativa TaxID=90675 RepID=A0ABM1QE13_CAMSA|nr:PREDICTED: probable LRR receptor-like serine/threonine-protein kinase At1g74360 [Camelina sativa]
MTIVTRVFMADDDSESFRFVCFLLFVFITALVVAGDSLDSDREALLSLRSYLESRNPQNRGVYTEWKREKQDVCNWPGIICTPPGSRVTGINLSDSTISGTLFGNFSALTQLTYLDLSRNTIEGSIPDDLSRCHNLKHLNLSHNIIKGKLSLPGLSNLEVLDLSVNRIAGDIQSSFPLFCNSLVVANLSTNNFTGRIDDIFNGCRNLKYVDLSSNGFSGQVWDGFGRTLQFSVADNFLSGNISASMFRGNCILEVLDLSGNSFGGEFPGQVSKCQNLSVLNLWGNKFIGKIPAEIGSISSLRGLYLGNNTFSRDIPETLLNLTNLIFLDLSRNKFGGDIQEIFGRFTQVKYMVLHANSYVGGIRSSNILKLPNLLRLDLGYNNFSGDLPAEVSQIQSLKFLIFAYNNFSGNIPQEYGNMPGLQALDLSFNKLTGSIPASFGNLTSLLWLMLANNSLSGEIPREIGNCRSLLWFNVANNQLSGRFHPELTKMGSNPLPTFEVNRQDNDKIIAGSGECLAMRRWIPAEFPPFNFVYAILTKKSCRSLWDHVLKGYGLFPVCTAGSTVRTLEISAYLQLSGNKLSGEIPASISQMDKLSTLHLGFNEFEGKLPSEIGKLPLSFLNLTRNKFSGEIPQEIGNLKCMQNLDLSYNNFSGKFPMSLNDLNELSKFNMSYNPFISGSIPTTGQVATFDKESFFGNPLLEFPSFFNQSGNNTRKISNQIVGNRPRTLLLIWISLALALAFIACLVVSGIILMVAKASRDAETDLLDGSKTRHDVTSSSGGSSPWLSGKIKVIRLDKSTFTYADILKATSNFSEERVVGRGGYGTVYRGVLPDGREVAVKKLQREGTEAEKEFRAEMEVLSANAFGDWAHPNLVRLYGWCLDGSEKILVHEYMGGGSLEELITDKTKLPWRKRVDIATDVARGLVFLHHECYPSIVHRDVKASNVLLDRHGNARVTDFGLARLLNAGDSHVSTVIAGTIGYVAPEYGQTWQATTRGDVYSYGILIMELATGRRAVDGGEECLVEWARRVMTGNMTAKGSPFTLSGTKPGNGAEQLTELLKVGVKCTADNPQARPNMKEVLAMLVKISGKAELFNGLPSPDYREIISLLSNRERDRER